MSVDFHIPKRAVIRVAEFKSRVQNLLGQVLPQLCDTAINISPQRPGIVVDLDAFGNATAIYRTELQGQEAVLLCYLGSDAVHRETYLVGLDVGQRASNVVWGILVAEALCELGGIGIDDEGFVSHHDGLLAPGQLLSILQSSEHGKLLLEAAKRKFSRDS